LPLYPAAVRTIDVRGHDLVISSTSRFAHGVRTPGAFHLSYCYNPPRFIYQADEYFRDGAPVRTWGRAPLVPVLAALRRWDQRAAQRPDVYVGISNTVAARIQANYGRAARVVHPPLDLTRFGTIDDEPTEGSAYYLVMSRLLPYKRVDLAIDACEALERRLIVVGSGPAEMLLRARAGSHVEFRSALSEAELTGLLAGATALIQPGLEDFGFAPLEANAAGTPAIAYAAGGALETVVNGTTGIHVSEQSVDALVSAMARCEKTPWDRASLRTHAAAFGEERFHAEMLDVLKDAGYASVDKSASTA